MKPGILPSVAPMDVIPSATLEWKRYPVRFTATRNDTDESLGVPAVRAAPHEYFE